MPADVVYSVEEYLTLEEDSVREALDVKYEFDGEQVYAMAGASLEHNRIAINIATAGRLRFDERTCDMMTSDMRVRVGERYVYPDVVGLCAEPEISDETPPSLLNPEFIVEIASPSTSTKDRTWKLEAYLQIDSLQELWLVETEAPRVQEYVRTGGNWVLHTHSGLETDIPINVFSIEIPMKEIYRRVFPTPP